MQEVASAQNEIDSSETSGAKEHKGATTQTVDGVHGNYGKYQIGDAGNHDLKNRSPSSYPAALKIS